MAPNPIPLPSDDDLVEVKKPTSLLVAQFFLFPLIVIAICVGIFVLFGYLAFEQKNPQTYLNEVRLGSETRRWQAAFELSKIVSSERERLRGSSFAQELIQVYRGSHDNDPRIRRYLALAMGQLGDPSAVPALVDGLDDRDLETQIYTLWAIGSIGDSSAVPGVLKKLQSGDSGVRKMAAYVLGALKDPAATRDLQVALNDVAEDVRWNAAMALAQLNDASGAEVLVELMEKKNLGKYPTLTEDQKTEIVVNAIQSLGVLKFERSRARIELLSKEDPNLAVRQAAIEALRKF